MIYALLGAAGVTAALGHGVDTAVIRGVVFINALVGFQQEGKTEKSLDAIRKMLSLHAMAVLNSRRIEILSKKLEPWGIDLLASGDSVPAGLRLVGMRSLRIEQAALTWFRQATLFWPQENIPARDWRETAWLLLISPLTTAAMTLAVGMLAESPGSPLD